jgi:hypothetical protein
LQALVKHIIAGEFAAVLKTELASKLGLLEYTTGALAAPSLLLFCLFFFLFAQSFIVMSPGRRWSLCYPLFSLALWSCLATHLAAQHQL